jgi:hypothetical protein
MQRRLLWLTAGLLAIALAAPRPCSVDEPPPEPIDCPLCAGNAKLHAALLNFLADSALDQIANAAAQPFVRA